MDVQQAKRHAKQRQQWATCDPFTLVNAAKQTLYGEIANGGSQSQTEQVAPLEEVISRFEQLTRASLGASAPAIPS